MEVTTLWDDQVDVQALGGEPVEDPQWDAWTPAEVADRLAGVDAPWAVAGGWALDLFLGRPTREHADTEVAVPRAGFDEIRRALAGFELDVVGGGLRWPLDHPAFDHCHQTWVREPGTGVYRLDVFREPHQDDTWICRRNPAIRLPYARVVLRTPDDVPYLAPEIVLLFKAKARRPQDEADFDRARTALAATQRGWLATALTATHPGHPWIETLSR